MIEDLVGRLPIHAVVMVRIPYRHEDRVTAEAPLKSLDAAKRRADQVGALKGIGVGAVSQNGRDTALVTERLAVFEITAGLVCKPVVGCVPLELELFGHG